MAKFAVRLENSIITYAMQQKMLYCAPTTRIGHVALERCFLTSATVGGITPGNDPGPGGSWDFGDED